MNRKVLLIEPNYKNKYPPMPLMKLASYYREIGDDVRFYKGDLRDLAVDLICQDLIKYLNLSFGYISWNRYYPTLFKFIKIKQVFQYFDSKIKPRDSWLYHNYSLAAFQADFAARRGYSLLRSSIKAPMILRPFDVTVYLRDLGTFFIRPCCRSFFSKRLVLPPSFPGSLISGKMILRMSLFRKPLIKYLPSHIVSMIRTVSGDQTLKPVTVFPFTFLQEQILPISSRVDFTGTISTMASRNLWLQALATSAYR